MNKKALVRSVVIAIIVSISAAALVGIIVLLAGTFGEIEGKVLTTALVTTFLSLTTLAGLRNFDSKSRSFQLLGVACVLASVVTLFITIPPIWMANFFDFPWQLAFSSGVITFALAHTSLLSPLLRSQAIVRYLTVATLVFIAFGALIAIMLINNQDGSEQDLTYRLLGVCLILSALGTITTPIIHRLTRTA